MELFTYIYHNLLNGHTTIKGPTLSGHVKSVFLGYVNHLSSSKSNEKYDVIYVVLVGCFYIIGFVSPGFFLLVISSRSS